MSKSGLNGNVPEAEAAVAALTESGAELLAKYKDVLTVPETERITSKEALTNIYNELVKAKDPVLLEKFKNR